MKYIEFQESRAGNILLLFCDGIPIEFIIYITFDRKAGI